MPVTRHSLRQGRNTSSTPYLVDGSESTTATTGVSSNSSSTVNWRRQWVVPNLSSGPLPGSINSTNTNQANGNIIINTPSINKDDNLASNDAVNGHFSTGPDTALPHLNFRVKMWVPVDLSGDNAEEPIVQGDDDDLLDLGILSQGAAAGKKAEGTNNNDLTAADIRGAVGGEVIPGITSNSYNAPEAKKEPVKEEAATVTIAVTTETDTEQPNAIIVDGEVKQSEEPVTVTSQDESIAPVEDTNILEQQQEEIQEASSIPAPAPAPVEESVSMDIDQKENDNEPSGEVLATTELETSVVPVQAEILPVPEPSNSEVPELSTAPVTQALPIQSEIRQEEKPESTTLPESEAPNQNLESLQNLPESSEQAQAKPTDADGDAVMDTA